MENQSLARRDDDECIDSASSHDNNFIATVALPSSSPWGKSIHDTQSFPPTISPDNDNRQRPHNNMHTMTRNCSPESCEKSNIDEKFDSDVLPMTTAITSPSQRQQHRRQKQPQITTTMTTSMAPMMVTPDANAAAKCAAAFTTSTTSTASVARRMPSIIIVSPPPPLQYAYQTPQKPAPLPSTSFSSSLSPSTGVTPFLNNAATATSSSNAHHRVPSYSPITPNTLAYMKSTSPFRSYMQFLDEKLHSVTKLDAELHNRIHDFEEHYYHEASVDAAGNYDDDEDDEGNGDNISSPTPSCMATQRMLNETHYYSTRTSTTACPRTVLQFHTPNSANSRGRSVCRKSHAANFGDRSGNGGGGTGDGRRRMQPYSDSFIRRRANDGIMTQTNRNRHRRSASYDDCGTKMEAQQQRHEKLVGFFLDGNATVPLEQQQQQELEHHNTPLSMDDTFVSSVDSSPVDFRRVLWKEGEASPPSPPCNDEASDQSESEDDNNTPQLEASHCKEIQRIRVHMTELESLLNEMESSSSSLLDLKEQVQQEVSTFKPSVAVQQLRDADHDADLDVLADDSVDQSTCDEHVCCSESSDYEESDEGGQEQHQQQVDVTNDSHNSMSFYIGEEEGFAMFESIEESDISETDVSGEDESYESFTVDENDDVAVENDVESKSKCEDTTTKLSQCENLQCLELRSKLQLSNEGNERMQRELERLKATQCEQTNQLIEQHRDDLERLRAEMASSASSALYIELTKNDALKDELATGNDLNRKMVVQHEIMQLEYSAEISSLRRNKLEVEAQVHSLQTKMEEMMRYYLDETSNLKASFDEERTALLSEHESVVRSMAKDFESILADKNCELEDVERLHRESTEENATKLSQLASQLEHAIASNNQLEEHNQVLSRDIDEVNTKLASITCEKDDLANNLANSDADIETLSLQLFQCEEEKGAIDHQLGAVRTERDDLLVQFASLKDSLEEATVGKSAIVVSLNDAILEISRQNDIITAMETERMSLSRRITVLEEKLASVNANLASITSEKDDLARNLANAHADIETLSLQLIQCEEEKGAIEQQLDDVRVERDELVVQVARLKDSLEEAMVGKWAMTASLNDATCEISRQSDLITAMETDRISLSNRITELNEQVDSQIMLLKSTQKEYESTMHEKDRQLDGLATQFRGKSAEHVVEVSQLECQLTSAIEAKEKMEVQLDAASSELSDSLGHVARLKDSLDESVAEKNTIKVDLDDARREVECQIDRIGALESEQLSQLNQMRELEQQMTPNDALLKSIQDDFDSKVEEKDKELDKVAHQLRTVAAEHAAQVSQFKGQLKSAVSERGLLEERNQMLTRDLDDTNTKLAAITCHHDCLALDLSASQADNEAISLQLKQSENFRADIDQKIATICIERDDLVVQVASLKNSLDEAIVEKSAIEASLNDATHEITCQKNHIAAMEVEHTSQSNQVRELDQQIAYLNAQLKSIQDDFEGTLHEKVRDLDEVAHQLQTNTEMHATQVSQLESKLTSAIQAKELIEAHNQMLMEDLDVTNSRLSTISIEKDELAANFATSQAANATLSLQVTRFKNDNAVIKQQLATVRAERGDLKGSLDEASIENESLRISLTDARQQIECRNDRISAMETEQTSLLNQIAEFQQQLASQQGINESLRNETVDQANKLISLHENIVNMQSSIASKDTRLAELSASNDDLVNKYLQLVKENEVDISEKNCLIIEQSFRISSETERKEEHQASCEVNEMKNLLSSAASESHSRTDLPIDDRPQTGLRFNRIQELDHILASMNNDSQALLDKVDHFQGLAAKLAVSVLKLKLQGNDNYDQMMIEKASFNDQFLALSEKGTELRWLYAKVMDKTGVIFDLRQENDQLMKENMRMLSEYQSKAAALEVDRTLMEQLQSENQSLKEISSDLLTEREASSKLRSQLIRTEVSLSELRAAMLNTDNSLEEVRQDRNRLSHEVDRLHVSIDALEKEKRSFSGCLHEYKEKIAQLSNRVTSMENYATSNSMQIHELESKLVSKMNKANMPINKASQDNMRSLVPSVDIQEANVDVAITSLRDSIDAFIQEFDHIVLQLDVSENDRNVLRDDSVAVTDSTTPMESEPSLTEDHIEPKESKGFMSEEDLDRIRTFMAKAQQITADSERKRNMLKMEVKRLRDDLERAEEELALAREDLLTINRMRNAVSQSKALLEKSEREKNQLKMENESIKSFMSASMETTASSSNHRQSVVSQVSSTERFKVEKGQSMFDMLKGTKKSGRKDFVKYRRAEE